MASDYLPSGIAGFCFAGEIADAVDAQTLRGAAFKQTSLVVVAQASVKEIDRVDDSHALAVRDALANRFDTLRRGVEIVDAAVAGAPSWSHLRGRAARWTVAITPATATVERVTRAEFRDTWCRVAQDALDGGFPLGLETADDLKKLGVLARRTAALWSIRLVVCADGEEAVGADEEEPPVPNVAVVIGYSHAVGDGTSSYRLVHAALRALDASLRGANITGTVGRLPVPVTLWEGLFGPERPYPNGWLEWLAALLMALVMRFAPHLVFHDTVPGIPLSIRAPLRSRMVFGRPIATEQWQAALTRMKQHNVRPQAVMYAAAMFCSSAGNRRRRVRIGEKSPTTEPFEFGMPITIRSSDRVTGEYATPSEADVAFTTGVGLLQDGVSDEDSFWDVAGRVQAAIGTAVQPGRLRLTTTVAYVMMASAIVFPPSNNGRNAVFAAPLEPINLGRFPFPDHAQFELVRLTAMNFGQRCAPLVQAGYAFVWPAEVSGRITFNAEYCTELWSPDQAERMLDTYTDLLLHPPQCTFGEYFAENDNDEYIFG